MVLARSYALIPVVTPNLTSASTEMVKAVFSGSVLLSVMSASPSSLARSLVKATQMSPRPYFVMKLMASGEISDAAHTRSPSFSRSSSSATMTIFPWRMSSIASLTLSKVIPCLPRIPVPRGLPNPVYSCPSRPPEASPRTYPPGPPPGSPSPRVSWIRGWCESR